MNDFYIPQKTNKEQWYKEPWMLLVLGGPFIVVLAAIFTFYVAWKGEDSVVSKDYYKQGVNINQTIHQDEQAIKYQMQGDLSLDSATGKLTLMLKGKTSLPSAVLLTISYKSNTSEFEVEQKITMSQMKEGVLQGTINIPTDKKKDDLDLWHVKIEGPDWRLVENWHEPLKKTIQLKPQNQ